MSKIEPQGDVTDIARTRRRANIAVGGGIALMLTMLIDANIITIHLAFFGMIITLKALSCLKDLPPRAYLVRWDQD